MIIFDAKNTIILFFRIYIEHLHLVQRKSNDILIDKNQIFYNFENGNLFEIEKIFYHSNRNLHMVVDDM